MGHRPDWNDTNFKKTPAVRKFADGTPGGVDEREAARDSAFTTALPDREPIVESYEYGTYADQQANNDRYIADMKAEATKELEASAAAREAAREMPAAAPKKQSFNEAFAENRKAGNKTFEWNGKKFTTDVAGSAPKGDQKVKKMYEDAAKAGRDYRAAAAAAKTESDRKILLNAAEESENKARLFGAGYANSAKKK